MLLQELSRAAAQGLVQADVAPPPAPPEISASEGPPPRAAAPPKMPPATPVPAYPGIRIETSVDRANAALPRPALTDKGAPCLPDRLFDLPAWGAELPPQTLIGTARSALVGEFDKVGEAELRRLVRAYLYLGFGAEAKSVMGGFGISLADAGPLFALAEIIDDGAAADPAIFAGQIGCDAPVALWAALSAPDLPSGREINRGAIIASFSALPLHLRRHLGPGLARRFLDFGDRETASRIRNAVTRAAGDHGSGLALTQARLDIAGGNLAAAGPLLDEIVSRDDSASPDALLVLLETRIGADEPPSPGDLLTAQALAFERQGTEQGARLARAAVLGTALNGDFDLAFADMERLPDAVAAPLRDELVELLVRRGSDAAFLRHLFAGAGTVTLPGATAIPAARRMLALGFPEAARALLAQHLDDSPEVRLLRAEIALRSGDAASALAGLRGLPGAAAEQLRAEAQLLLGDLTAARAHLAAAGSAGRLGNLAWRAGDWETVARLGTDARKRLAESRMRSGPAEADPAGSETNLPPTLGKARALVEQGAETRSLVRDLLAEAR